MASVPPGGQGPIDPNQWKQWGADQKAQAKIWREQQKAQMHAQRDAWKAHRQAWKAQVQAQYGPRVNSISGPLLMIAIGVIAFLLVTGKLDNGLFWSWYGHWWPLILIGAGLVMLGEWFLDMRRNQPIRRRAGIFWICTVLVIAGIGASGWNHLGIHGPWDWNRDNGDFFNSLGLPEHDEDLDALQSSLPNNAVIEVQNPRGDVSVVAGNDQQINVEVHAVAFARTDGDAKKIFDAEKPRLKVSGGSVLVQSDGTQQGRVNLELTVPKNAHVNIRADHGDVTASGMGAGLYVNAPHGDVHLSSIVGGVQAKLAKGEFAANDVTGDISADGPCSDLSLSGVQGRVTLNCDYFDQLRLERISGAIHFRTSKTDVQLAELSGSLSLNDDELHVSESHGDAHIVTHSRDISLDQVYGSVSVEDRDGTINVDLAGLYPVWAKNSKGDVNVTVPQNVSGQVAAQSHNGEIESEYGGPQINEGAYKTATFPVGGGSCCSKITLDADNGDVRIKRGAPVVLGKGVPAATGAAKPAKDADNNAGKGAQAHPIPAAPAAPKAPAAPLKPSSGQHFKASGNKPVVQQ